MSEMWKSVKKTLNCKSETSEVSEPKPRKTRTRARTRTETRTRNRISCCKSRLKDVKDHDDFDDQVMKRKIPTNLSPMSIRSSDLINPITNLVRLSNLSSGGSPYVPVVSSGSSLTNHLNGGLDSFSRTNNGSNREFTCHKCSEPLTRHDIEAHLLSKHAVREVVEGDSSRKIIEMIFKAGWTSFENRARIERILKVQNPQTRLAEFEEYRELVKIRANRLQHSKKHPRCLADGNELLRFYGTTLCCQLGRNGCSTLCTFQECNVCCILKHGFSGLVLPAAGDGVFGIFTTSTSERADRSIEIQGEESRDPNKALRRRGLIVCRVIAGRVHKPLVAENIQELVCERRRSGFDSLAGKMGYNSSHIEELYLFNPTALLPCFVVIICD